jgi:deazaflavin-dependent oxidoreductase (nitroreductase family)
MRALFRAPIGLYRAHLGWVFGERLLLLETIGRKSGLPRSTVLEVVAHDREADAYFVVAGFGAQSAWLLNAIANPPTRVTVGRRSFVPECRELSEPERVELLTSYQREHPRVAAALGSRVLGADFTSEPAAIARLAHELPALRLAVPAPPNPT